MSWPRIVHVGAWVLMVLLAAQWLSVNQSKLSQSLSSARDESFRSIRDALQPRTAAALPAAPSISPQQAAILDALTVKASKQALSAEEAAMLSAVITEARAPAVVPPKVEDPAAAQETIDRLWSRHARAFDEAVRPALAFAKMDLLLGAIPVAALMAALWRLRQALLVAGRWGLRSDRAYRRYDQVMHTLAIAAGLKIAVDVGLRVLGLYPSGWPWSGSGGDFVLFLLALSLWFAAPGLVRSEPRSLLAWVGSEAARRRYSQVSHLIAGLAGLLLTLDIGMAVLHIHPGRPDEGFDAFLFAVAILFWLVVPRLIRWIPRMIQWRRTPRGRRALEAELEAVRAKAEALAQENSQFV